MAEKEETSGSKPSEEIWAKLVPSNSQDSDIELNLNETIVSSEMNTSSFVKNGWCIITRNSDLCSATIRNTCSNAMLVNGTIVQTEATAVIKCGSKIILLPNPNEEGNLSYKFKLMAAEERSKKLLEICVDAEHAKCCICLSIWHDVVTAAPCLHNFCNGCFSEWLKRSQEKHSSVLCPQCRAVVQFVGRNHFLHNIEEDILKSDSSLKRSDEEFALLDSYALIKSPLVINARRNQQRKRQRSPLIEESVVTELPCPQCGTQFGGFQCNQNTVHLQCQACGGMMPSRTNITAPQHCVGCERAFCGVYWQTHSVTASESHPVCNPETLKRISERTIPRIPLSAHENNRHEQDITERCIRQTGKTLQNVISDWITKFNNREIDRTTMPLKHAETITAGTHVCNECYDKLVSFLLYWFRVSLPRHHLPADVSQREDCWYGYRCRTQHHSEEHARKRNHVCRPTRGSAV